MPHVPKHFQHTDRNCARQLAAFPRTSHATPYKRRSTVAMTVTDEGCEMSTDNERDLEEKLWKSLTSDRTVMLGLDGVDDGHSRPMTAIVEHHGGPVWFFTGKTNEIAKSLPTSQRAIAAFSSKGHDLFASIHGNLVVDPDRAVINRLWNPFIAAWFDGKDDPNLVLLRFDCEHAEVWLNESSLLAGVKMLFGRDPKEDYKDKVGNVDLR